ncbi:MAG: 50S ribosomal protein L5 [Candidatus Atribacteria bacterium]|nr:50S ribosomal protein L5 [Candidatus Atribacteria bacterium]MCD6349239.1 50S ribosomal protein L5 [Candidatus Atribacteria bacterium]
MSVVKEKYENEVVPALLKRFGYKNPMQVPKLEKVVINMGVGDATQNSRYLDLAVEELSLITGQKPLITRARKSISNFKLRKGMAIGCKVTLRGDRMYEFLDRFLNIAIARIRDFRGFPDSCFDGKGNCTIGIEEQLIFPEISYDKVERVRGMNISFVTTAKSDEEARALLELLGLPFRKS